MQNVAFGQPPIQSEESVVFPGYSGRCVNYLSCVEFKNKWSCISIDHRNNLTLHYFTLLYMSELGPLILNARFSLRNLAYLTVFLKTE